MDGQLKPVGNACFCQKLFGSCRIIRFGFQVRTDTEKTLGKQLACLDCDAFHHTIHNGISIDGLGNRFSNSMILERILDRTPANGLDERRILTFMVQVEVDDAV